MGGRPRTPTAILKLNDSRCLKGRENEPEPKTGRPDCPEYLAEVGRAKWEEVSILLLGMRVLTVVDGDTLGQYCAAFESWREVEGLFQSAGDPDEKLKWRRMGNDLTRLCFMLGSSLGLNPAARSRLKVTPKKPDASTPFVKRAGTA